jgi:hypothetical protein
MKRWIIAAAVAGTVATGALAVTVTGTGTVPALIAAAEAHGWRGGGHGWRGGMQGGPMLDGAHVEAGLAFARTRIGITPAQAPQWDALADVVRAQAAALMPEIEALRDLRRGEGEAVSAPERLERLEAAAGRGVEALSAVRAAFGELYAVLDDGQRAQVDTMLTHGPRGEHRGDGPGPRGPRGERGPRGG